MSDLPERIWAFAHNGFITANLSPTWMPRWSEPAEYIRADLLMNIHHGYDADGQKFYAGGNVIYEIPVSKFPDEIGRMAERLRAGKGE